MSILANDKSMAGQTERESFNIVPLKMYFIQKHEKWVRCCSIKPYQTLFQTSGIQVHTVQNLFEYLSEEYVSNFLFLKMSNGYYGDKEHIMIANQTHVMVQNYYNSVPSVYVMRFVGFYQSEKVSRFNQVIQKGKNIFSKVFALHHGVFLREFQFSFTFNWNFT